MAVRTLAKKGKKVIKVRHRFAVGRPAGWLAAGMMASLPETAVCQNKLARHHATLR